MFSSRPWNLRSRTEASLHIHRQGGWDPRERIAFIPWNTPSFNTWGRGVGRDNRCEPSAPTNRSAPGASERLFFLTYTCHSTWESE